MGHGLCPVLPPDHQLNCVIPGTVTVRTGDVLEKVCPLSTSFHAEVPFQRCIFIPLEETSSIVAVGSSVFAKLKVAVAL